MWGSYIQRINLDNYTGGTLDDNEFHTAYASGVDSSPRSCAAAAAVDIAAAVDQLAELMLEPCPH